MIELGGQIEEVDFGGGDVGVGDDDQRVDFEVGKLAVDVDGVEAGDEVDEDIVDSLGDFFQETGGDFVVAGVLGEIDGDEHLFGFGVDIADINAAFVVEEDPIALKLYC